MFDKVWPVLLPAAVITLVLMILAWRPWRRTQPIELGNWGGVLALSFSFLVAFCIVIRGLPNTPPADKWQWIFFIVVQAMMLGLIAAIWRPEWIFRIIIGIGVAVATSILIQPVQSLVILKLLVGGAVFLTWLNMEAISHYRIGPSVPFGMMFVFASISILMYQVPFPSFSLISAALAVCFGMMFVVGLATPSMTLENGATYPASAILVSILVISWENDQLVSKNVPSECFLLLAGAPFALWIGEIKAIANLPTWGTLFIRAVLVLIPCLIALGMSVENLAELFLLD